MQFQTPRRLIAFTRSNSCPVGGAELHETNNALFLGLRAHITRRLEAIALAGVVGLRWISAPWALCCNSLARIVIAIQSGRDLGWTHAVLYPMCHGRDDVMLDITSGRGLTERSTDRVRARTAHTMAHSRCEKQSIEGLNSFNSAHPRCNRLVITDRRACRDRGICPAMVLNQFATGRTKAVRSGFVTSTDCPALVASA